MQYRYLGKDRLKVSAIGYGCPPFQGKLSDADERQAIAVLDRAIDIGMNFIDTADHNNGNNEEILAKVLKGRRGDVVLTANSAICAASLGRKAEKSKASRSMWRGRATTRCAGCKPITSISTIFIASIPKCRSKKPSAR